MIIFFKKYVKLGTLFVNLLIKEKHEKSQNYKSVASKNPNSFNAKKKVLKFSLNKTFIAALGKSVSVSYGAVFIILKHCCWKTRELKNFNILYFFAFTFF